MACIRTRLRNRRIRLVCPITRLLPTIWEIFYAWAAKFGSISRSPLTDSTTRDHYVTNRFSLFPRRHTSLQGSRMKDYQLSVQSLVCSQWPGRYSWFKPLNSSRSLCNFSPISKPITIPSIIGSHCFRDGIHPCKVKVRRPPIIYAFPRLLPMVRGDILGFTC